MRLGRIDSTLLVAAILAGTVTPVLAQGTAARDWPKGPVRIVVGFAPGGGVDILARTLGPKLVEQFGQPFVVDNRPGAGANIAAEHVARAPADGHTLMFATSSTLVVNPAVYSKLPYDPLTSFEFVSNITIYPFLVVVSATGPINTVQELIAWGKANPAKANFGSASTLFQLPAELFNMRTGVKFEHIPFKGGPEIMTAIINGQVTMAITDPGSSLPLVKGGRLRALASTGPKRTPQLPETPTLAEAGVSGIVVESSSGIIAPKGTPAAVVNALDAALAQIVRMADVRERFAQLGMQAAEEGGPAFAARVAREITVWRDVASKAGIKLD